MSYLRICHAYEYKSSIATGYTSWQRETSQEWAGKTLWRDKRSLSKKLYLILEHYTQPQLTIGAVAVWHKACSTSNKEKLQPIRAAVHESDETVAHAKILTYQSIRVFCVNRYHIMYSTVWYHTIWNSSRSKKFKLDVFQNFQPQLLTPACQPILYILQPGTFFRIFEAFRELLLRAFHADLL